MANEHRVLHGNDARAGWIVALVTLAIASMGGLATLSARAGSLENRVTWLESRQANMEGDMKKLLDGQARVEQKVDDLKQRQ